MDHNEALQQQATERYLLNELDRDQREQFEEHFFGCQECALDVRAAAMFIDGVKVVGAEQEQPARVPVLRPASPSWLAWLRPAFAVPVFGMLLAVIGYDHLVTLPPLEAASHRPVIYSAASLNLKTYSATPTPLAVHSGDGFILNVIVPPDAHFASYRAELHNPAGGVESSFPISSAAVDTWTIGIPRANRQPGAYNLIVQGITAQGQETEVGRGSFELQIQN